MNISLKMDHIIITELFFLILQLVCILVNNRDVNEHLMWSSTSFDSSRYARPSLIVMSMSYYISTITSVYINPATSKVVLGTSTANPPAK